MIKRTNHVAAEGKKLQFLFCFTHWLIWRVRLFLGTQFDTISGRRELALVYLMNTPVSKKEIQFVGTLETKNIWSDFIEQFGEQNHHRVFSIRGGLNREVGAQTKTS